VEEVAVLKLALMKFGVGKWSQIVDSDCLPGKLIQQLNGQTQRLMGQQSLAGACPPPPADHKRPPYRPRSLRCSHIATPPWGGVYDENAGGGSGRC
jgi:hypothetical protein